MSPVTQIRSRTVSYAIGAEAGGPAPKLLLLHFAHEWAGPGMRYTKAALASLAEVTAEELDSALVELQTRGLVTWSDAGEGTIKLTSFKTPPPLPF